MKPSTETLLASRGFCVLPLGVGLPWEAVVREASALIGRRPIGFDGTSDCSGVNLVTLGVGGYRSASTSSLGLHQEGYADEVPLGWLALYCVEASGSGGETLVVDARTVFHSLSRELYAQLLVTDVRFSKDAVNWTPWRPLLEPVNDGNLMVRFAQAERGFRQVDLRPPREGLLEHLSQQLHAHAVAHPWRPGDLLLIDNHRCLHGRTRIQEPARRSLLRMAFPFEEPL
jgi:alpha-ketoglutarate-dependent taurine dioxygenase